MKKPLVSVIMPVFNAEKYVGEAIESILNQSFTDFEFLIFNDGSTDKSAEIIKSYKDSRIKLFDYKENFGYVKHLNEGIRIAEGKYIARMDADDISLPERFQKQVDFLEKNKDIGLCGTWFSILGKEKQIKTLLIHEEIKIDLFFRCAFGHPTVFIRKDILVKNSLKYNNTYLPAEDYELWTRLVKYTQVANIPEILLNYRLHKNQITKTSNFNQTDIANKIRISYLKNINIFPDKEEIDLNCSIINSRKIKTLNLVEDTNNWIDKLISANEKYLFFDKNLFRKIMLDKRKKIILNYFIRDYYNLNTLKELFSLKTKIPLINIFKICVKSILHKGLRTKK